MDRVVLASDPAHRARKRQLSLAQKQISFASCAPFVFEVGLRISVRVALSFCVFQ